MEDAVSHSRKVLTVLAKSEYLNLKKNREEVSEALKIIGCVPHNKADEKFLVSDNLETMIYSENVAFPLSAYTQIIDTNGGTFSFGLDMLTEGGAKNSLVSTWLAVQQMAENEKGKNKE